MEACRFDLGVVHEGRPTAVSVGSQSGSKTRDRILHLDGLSAVLST